MNVRSLLGHDFLALKTSHRKKRNLSPSECCGSELLQLWGRKSSNLQEDRARECRKPDLCTWISLSLHFLWSKIRNHLLFVTLTWVGYSLTYRQRYPIFIANWREEKWLLKKCSILLLLWMESTVKDVEVKDMHPQCGQRLASTATLHSWLGADKCLTPKAMFKTKNKQTNKISSNSNKHNQ